MLGMIRGPLPRIAAIATLVLLAAQGVDASAAYSQTIYRASAFSTQASDRLCTAAVVQNVVNLVTGASGHSETQQRAYYAYGRAHNRYAYRNHGVDPQGVEAMLERYVPGSDWRQVKRKSLQAVLRVAARGMRATDLPAVLFVGGGSHVWTMNGYTATADPASGTWFNVTHVRFSGPHYPKQVRRYGWFDLPPNARREAAKLATPYFPYRERLAFGDHRWTPWNGYYVAVVPWSIDGDQDPEPTPDATPPPTPPPMPDPTPDATPDPTPDPSLGPVPTDTPTVPPAPTPEITPESIPASVPEPTTPVSTAEPLP
jgi:hypothetical protein